MKFTHFGNRRLEFGPGAVLKLPGMLAEAGKMGGSTLRDIILITGAASLEKSASFRKLTEEIEGLGLGLHHVSCLHEPSPSFVDETVGRLIDALGKDNIIRGEAAVAGIGGGSAMDAGKAVAAMLPVAAEESPSPSVKEFLEGVGSRKAPGMSLLYAACPTTAGTGSEATKNAVISRVGEGGFKKSLRHDNYLPPIALIDPELQLTVPREVSAASGLDALTQILESWTSPAASPFVSDLCAGGVAAFARAYERVLKDGGDLEARSDMAYAAHISGIALANAGLGSVHGLASPVGGRFSIPHGLICAALVKPGARLNMERLKALLSATGATGEDTAAYRRAYLAYARAGYLLNGNLEKGLAPDSSGADMDRGCALLLEGLDRLLSAAGLPGWQSFGFDEREIPALAAQTSAKANPVPLGAADYERLLREALLR